MSKTPGKCIFCGGGKLSKEHVFPNWMRERYPRNPLSTHTHGTIRWIDGEQVITKKKGQGHSGSKKLRIVCRNCNNGWMSRLETAVKPTLISLIDGQTTTLDVQQKLSLALWASKVMCVAEYLNEGWQRIRTTDRNELFEHSRVPEHWRVFLTPYSGTEFKDLYLHLHTGSLYTVNQEQENSEEHYLESCALGMGKAIISVVATSWPLVGAHIANFDMPAFRRISPTSDEMLNWNPEPSLDDASARLVVRILEPILVN